MSEPAGGPGAADALTFLLGVHNHQPAGNFDGVIALATERAYHPFLALLDRFPELPVALHTSGSLLVWFRERAPRTFDLLGALAARGQVELLTGGFHEPILPLLPEWDKVGQIQALTDFLRREFGVRPRGLWLAERVWEPHLPKALREAGVEYVLVDDSHFALAGLDPSTLGGYFLTEEQGSTLAVFPISQRLRYLVPFADPRETLACLREREGAGTSLTLLDDGEKFGVWPGTHRLCHEEGWLRRFFEALLGAGWLRLSTPSRYLDAAKPRGRIYLPTASYREMGEWALPAEAALELEEAKHRIQALPDGERLATLLRGGFWRNFLVKYPEVNDLYWTMLRVSRRIHAGLARRPRDARLLEARRHLWRGQGNDAYWHGVFGGCYLPHLRRTARQGLLTAERLVDEVSKPGRLQWSREDLDGDGRAEVRLVTATLALTLHPAAGGSLSELAYRPRPLDLGDVLARRPEAYHARVKAAAAQGAEDRVRTIHERVDVKESGLAALLAYDRFRRASLLEGLFPASGNLDPLHPWDLASLALPDQPLAHRIRRAPGRLAIVFSAENPGGWPLLVEKTLTVGEWRPEITVGYRLRWTGTSQLHARWGVQWNLALTGGDLPERHWDLPERPSLRSRGALAEATAMGLVDEWIALRVGLDWTPSAALGWAPVETVSLSEAGIERIFQGSALLLAWPLHLDAGQEWRARVTLAIEDRANSP